VFLEVYDGSSVLDLSPLTSTVMHGIPFPYTLESALSLPCSTAPLTRCCGIAFRLPS
jgi:hypothetical protein